ncbi:biotin--[acetyl-CoA-carboxylase] ligase [Clostridium folliculivorans]|uniref:Bifunctional ligase/repressor BirA n=1 Tax=Clostridium folliculivorans TaxID=2886038 RepID=A0A9W6DBG6_9CLOT|nr:biotin--[acetyl-CoA-carboxylase] ligase [Clostridium folliculivorans]GKU25698.1 bifunctional ligase/repressor BirA [Clostridium folliculivorans]GKU28720.1 bifunctional ligase/repressor BirA [Clostridium folliculivorans]
MKEKILEILKESKNFVSGETICKEFGITRSAVWKYIKSLKEDGYNIESYPKKGYKLVFSPDYLNKSELKPYLNNSNFVKDILYFDSINSTNTYSKKIANEASNGTVVIAEEQTLGKGRFDRTWISPKYKGIWFSVILKPDIDPILVTRITQIAAASVHLATLKHGFKTMIKWPNDIILNNKKLGGILIEMSCELSQINYIVIGMGINVNLEPSDFPEEVKDKATSLRIEGSKVVDRKILLADILNNFEELYKEFLINGSIQTALEICKLNSSVLGKDIKIIHRGNETFAKAVDLNEDGNLIVSYEDGSIKPLYSGEVSIRGLDGYV